MDAQMIGYLALPFQPWWDVEKYGNGGNCEICGAIMVRPKDNRQGWLCMSCDTFVPDQEANP